MTPPKKLRPHASTLQIDGTGSDDSCPFREIFKWSPFWREIRSFHFRGRLFFLPQKEVYKGSSSNFREFPGARPGEFGGEALRVETAYSTPLKF